MAWTDTEMGVASDRTWLCAICQLFGGPCYSTSKYAGIYKPERGKLMKVSGSTHSRFLMAGNCPLAWG